MLSIKKLLMVPLVSLMIGCGTTTGGHNNSGSTSSGGSESFNLQEKSFLYNLFLTEYFWNDTVPLNMNVALYNDPQNMIDALKNSAVDRWSFVMTSQEYDNFTSQQYAGFGFSYTDDFRILYTQINSPSDLGGLKRGDKILSVNGASVTSEVIAAAANNLNTTSYFVVLRDGSEVQLAFASRVYNFLASSYSIIQTPDGQNVGYYRLDTFSTASTQEIEQAFYHFKSQGIQKLVVDLRYNGGGAINTASILLDKIGYAFNNLVQFTLKWNPQNSDKNEVYTFDSRDANSIDITDVVFLTTSETASASELVINTMEPYLQNRSTIIGTPTHGKPVGMQGRINQSYIYFLINFVVENSVGYYDYFNGMQPDCHVYDNDFTHQLGDPNEALLKEALYYLVNGHC